MRKILKYGLFSLTITLVVAGPMASLADEQLGELKLSDFLVEPTFLSSEKAPSTTDSQNGFGLGNSYFAASWKLQRVVSGRLQLADQELINRPTWNPQNTRGLGFVEAYAQIETVLGTLRAGLIPLAFGLDGSTPETQLWFPRSQVYRDNQLVLRDYGVSYGITHNGFFTDIAGHNGEGGTDQDKRLWQTARWGWRGGAGMQAGISGATGYYLTPTSADTKSRIGNAFLGMDLYAIGLGAEATVGERKSKLAQTQFFDWYFSFRHALGKNWGLLARYEYYDPSSRVRDDSQKQALGGLYVNNDTNTSRLSVMYTKNWEEADEQTANDEFRIIWRVTSAYLK